MDEEELEEDDDVKEPKDVERAADGDGGFTFDSDEDKAQLKAQRQQLWAW